MNPQVAARVARAVVRFPRLGGQGVVVPGGFVLTAAHCIGWTAEGYMALGDYFTEKIVAADGREFMVSPLAVEPVSDLAVLGAVDGQASDQFAEAADAFEAFCETTKPVRLAIGECELFVPFAAYVFTHNKGILQAQAKQWTPEAQTLAITANDRIDGGTSGGPVVNSDGGLLGIVSHSAFTASEAGCVGGISRVQFAAPLWLVRRMVPGATRKKLDAALPPGRLRRRDIQRWDATNSAKRA